MDTAGQAHEDVGMDGPEIDGLQQRSNPGQQQLKSFLKNSKKVKHGYMATRVIR